MDRFVRIMLLLLSRHEKVTVCKRSLSQNRVHDILVAPTDD